MAFTAAEDKSEYERKRIDNKAKQCKVWKVGENDLTSWRKKKQEAGRKIEKKAKESIVRSLQYVKSCKLVAK